MAELRLPLNLEGGNLIVFEGLDGTGTSTQLERLRKACYDPAHGEPLFAEPPLFEHQPSGGLIGDTIYTIEEDHHSSLDPLARQYLHLAAHAQHWRDVLEPALASGRSVFMDRCWWSTVAYGWFGNRAAMLERDISRRAWTDACRMPEGFRDPDIVFVFTEVHRPDGKNSADIAEGYEWLAHEYGGVKVPPGNEAEQSLFILRTLAERAFYRNGE